MPIKLPSLDLCFDRISKESNTHSFHLCAVAFTRSGHIIASSANRQLTRADGAKKWTEHAEEGLVRKLHNLKARQRFRTVYVLVARWSDAQGWLMAKPCGDCWRRLNNYDVDGVFYTNADGDIEDAFRFGTITSIQTP